MDEKAKALPAEEDAVEVLVRAQERSVNSDYPPVELPQGWRFGRYELLGRLAYGGMAEIYLARESACGLAVRYVVIKRVLPHIATDEEFVGMFMDEARVAMRLTHPNISHIYEFGRLEGSFFLAMEWVNGIPLNRIIRRCFKQGASLPQRFAVKIIASVAEALEYAHTARDETGKPLGIIHRDVTPHNIMLSFDGTVKLLDFGIALASSRNTDTRTGLVRGKLAYMSPQQSLARPIDARADVFSLGVCLYEALTGRRLYKRDTDFEICEAIIKGPVPSLLDANPELPAELDALVQRCLEKEPDARFQSAGEVQVALAGFLAQRQEASTSFEMASMLREKFASEHADGPQLTTRTDLLHALPRMASDNPLPVLVSSGPLALGRDLGLQGLPAGPADNDTREITATRTRSIVAAGGGGPMAYVFLISSLLAVSVAAFAVWSLTMRLRGSVTAPAQATADVREAVPAVTQPEPSAPVDEQRGPPVEIRAPVPGEQADPRRGKVWLTSDPKGAQVFLNGHPTGSVTPTQIQGVWPGVYRITLRQDGYETFRTRVHVTAAQVSQVTAHMMTTDEARAYFRERARVRRSDDSSESTATDSAAEDFPGGSEADSPPNQATPSPEVSGPVPAGTPEQPAQGLRDTGSREDAVGSP